MAPSHGTRFHLSALSRRPTLPSKKDQPLYVAESTEATITGEPGFRAKRDYEEASTSSSRPSTAAKAPALQPTPKGRPSSAPAAEALAGVTMDDDQAAREGEPSAVVDVDSDTTDAGEDDPFPLGSFPCANFQAVVAKGMLFCFKCKAPQTDESSKITKKFFENEGLRIHLLATAAAGARKPVENLISADIRQHKEERPNVRRSHSHQRRKGSRHPLHQAQLLECR